MKTASRLPATADTARSLSRSFGDAFEKAEKRTAEIFAIVRPEAYEARPIPLRHPIVFYEGHLEAFIWNTLFRRTLHQPAFNEAFDRLFERGIDPGDKSAAEALTIRQWPPREEILAYKRMVRERLRQFIDTTDLTLPENARARTVLHVLLEHELMHQETLLYILHQLPYDQKIKPGNYAPVSKTCQIENPEAMIEIPAGVAIMGAQPGSIEFGWDNEFGEVREEVPAFRIQACNVTNGQFLEFIESGGYDNRAYWTDESWHWKERERVAHPFFWKRADDGWRLRDFFEEIPLPVDWPVNVTHAEACAYAKFRGLDLPTEAEWHRAAFGDVCARYPWGDEPANGTHGNFDFKNWSPAPVGSYPQGASCYGVHDLYGHGWEWTSTPFAPFPGFEPMESYPVYSADFFDGRHFVMKGASCFTDARLIRPSLRNWFYNDYPYMYATFRCVKR